VRRRGGEGGQVEGYIKQNKHYETYTCTFTCSSNTEIQGRKKEKRRKGIG
jgi:hypothetical protein